MNKCMLLKYYVDSGLIYRTRLRIYFKNLEVPALKRDI